LIKHYFGILLEFIFQAWIGALSSSLDLLCSSPASFLTDVIGPRKMAMIGGTLISTGLILSGFVRSLKLYFLTLSLLPAIGSAAVRSAVCAIIPNYFVKRLGLATGIVYSIASVITVTSPFLVAYLLEALGVQKTFLIMGSYYITIIVLATSFKSVLPRKKLTNFKEILKDSTKIGILKNPNYLCWIISSMFAYYGATFLLLAVVCFHF
jgi:MFS family permease